MSNNHSENEAKRYSKLFVFSGGNKAGMETMDKDKQAQIIYDMSKNSAYFKRATRLDEITNHKSELMKKQFDLVDETINPSLFRKLAATVHQRCLELEKRRRFTQICCVLDMDMFYAAVEIRDQPHLKDLPVAVGGNSMISTSNYVARKYGVRAAMPGFIAKKLCPNLVFVNCNFDKYQAVANQIRSIIQEYDPYYSSHSLDEVYFNLTDAAMKRYIEQMPENQLIEDIRHSNITCADNNDEEDDELQPTIPSSLSLGRDIAIEKLRKVSCDILQEIRCRIKETTGGLTSSAGIANNFFLAKICADINKPDGQYELPPRRDSVIEFVTNLPCRKVGGIGKVTEKILENLGMTTMGDVRNNLHCILHTFTPLSSEFLMRVSMGIASEEGTEKLNSTTNEENPLVTRKSIGCERTFSAKGISDRDELLQRLHLICENVSADMKKENIFGKTVTVKLKDIDFNLHTKCRSSANGSYSIQSVESIEQIAKSILVSCLPMKVRLLGVTVSKFKNSFHGTKKSFKFKSVAELISNQKDQQRQCPQSMKLSIQHSTASHETHVIDLVDDFSDNEKDRNGENSRTFIERPDIIEANRISEADPILDKKIFEICQNRMEPDFLLTHEFSQEERDSTFELENSTRLNWIQYSCSDNDKSMIRKHEQEGCSDCQDELMEVIEIYTPPDSKSSIDSVDKKIESFACPVCNNLFESHNLTKINSHLDSCLVKMSSKLSGQKRPPTQSTLPSRKEKKIASKSIITAFFKSK